MKIYETLTSKLKSMSLKLKTTSQKISQKTPCHLNQTRCGLSTINNSKQLNRTFVVYRDEITTVIRGSLNMFPDFFVWELLFEVISSRCNVLVVPFQQLLEGPMEVLLCERFNDLRHSLFHLLNCLITTSSEFRE